MEGKSLRKGVFLMREWKTPRKMSTTTGIGSESDDGEELGDDDAPD